MLRKRGRTSSLCFIRDAQKRGQLTIFIILAIVMVVGIILFYYFNSQGFGEKTYDPKVEILRQDFLECFERSFEESLVVIGIQGGYFDVPEPKELISGYFFSFELPYYYYEGELNVPSREIIENNIRGVARDLIVYCSEGDNFSESYDSVSLTEGDVLVKIYEGYVSFTPNIFMDVSYDSKNVRVDFSKSPVIVNSDLYYMHEIANFLAEYYRYNKEWTPFSDVVSQARVYDLYASIVDSVDGYENSVEISSRKEDYFPQSFYFKNKFSHEYLREIEPLL